MLKNDYVSTKLIYIKLGDKLFLRSPYDSPMCTIQKHSQYMKQMYLY